MGHLFESLDHLRKKIRHYCVQEGVEIIRRKNEKLRVTVECKDENCGWRMHASPYPSLDSPNYKIKTMKGDHTCERHMGKNTNATSNMIAEFLSDRLKSNPNMSIPDMKNEMILKFGVEPSYMQLWRAKNIGVTASKELHAASLLKLWSYADVIKEADPGTYVKIETSPTEEDGVVAFKRCFVAFDALVTGFLNGCRPFIGLDGCHLKGPFGGVLLTAVALDGNSSIHPVAIAAVEGETNQTWLWFMEHLNTVLSKMPSTTPLVFMSDRQKVVILH